MYDIQGLFKDPLNTSVFIVAEIGINHNGNLQQAYQLIDYAVHSGASAVKFQVFQTGHFINPRLSPEAYEVFLEYELSRNQFDEIQRYCKDKGVPFFATPLDDASLDYLIGSEVPCIKLASSDLTTEPMLEKAALSNIPVILSSGMADTEDIEKSIRFFDSERLALLYCVSEYPVSPEQVDLNVIPAWQGRWDFPVGFSDHSTGIELSLAAVAKGARIIERHFTIDRSLPGGDHAMSLEPDEFTRMVGSIRNIEAAQGTGRKQISGKERAILPLSRKAMYASRDIKEGEIIHEEDIFCMRPGTGVTREAFRSLVGKKAEKDFALYEEI